MVKQMGGPVPFQRVYGVWAWSSLAAFALATAWTLSTEFEWSRPVQIFLAVACVLATAGCGVTSALLFRAERRARRVLGK